MNQGSDTPRLHELRRLEQKIEKVLERLVSLREENDRLEKQVTEKDKQLAQINKRVKKLEKELNDPTRGGRDVEKEQAIRKKLTALLEKLNDLET